MSAETHFRIVIDPKRPANSDGHFPWQCTLCGASVSHVDQHAAYHLNRDGIEYGAPLESLRAASPGGEPRNLREAAQAVVDNYKANHGIIDPATDNGEINALAILLGDTPL